jgi:hypothetical protein
MTSQQAAGNNLEEETGWRLMDDCQKRENRSSHADAQEDSSDIEEFMLSERQIFDEKVDEETGWRLLNEKVSRRGGTESSQDKGALIPKEKFDEVQLGGQAEKQSEKPETYQQQLDVVKDRQEKAMQHQFESEPEKVLA